MDGLPDEARKWAENRAHQIVIRDSIIYPDGAAYTGNGPGLRTEIQGPFMLTYLTDVRRERIVIIQMVHVG